MNRRALGSAVALALVLAPAGVVAAEGGVRIEALDAAPPAFRVAVLGLAPAQIAALRSASRDAWPGWFSLHVADPANPPVAARYAVVADRVELEPRFPLEAGLAYVAVFRPGVLAAQLGGAAAGDVASIGAGAGGEIRRRFELPKPASTPTTHVTAIQPSRAIVPENLLKFYIHFSAPMTRGRAYRHLRILDARGEVVELAFLELEYELWDPDARRLTLLFDPGRLKAGLKPRREIGPALEGGHDFAIEVDAQWPDAEGSPLREGLLHRFRVGPPDHDQPDPEAWTWSAPLAGTRDPLIVDLGEPLDGALLQHALWVVSAGVAGERAAEWTEVAGSIELAEGESVWRFTPSAPWSSSAHELRADVLLEDLAGNSVARPFEVDLSGPGTAGASARGAGVWRRSFVPAP